MKTESEIFGWSDISAKRLKPTPIGIKPGDIIGRKPIPFLPMLHATRQSARLCRVFVFVSVG